MKQKWEHPRTFVQEFEPNEYVAVCGMIDGKTVSNVNNATFKVYTQHLITGKAGTSREDFYLDEEGETVWEASPQLQAEDGTWLSPHVTQTSYEDGARCLLYPLQAAGFHYHITDVNNHS